jgi:hypothetical protein
MASGREDFREIPAAIFCLTRITSYATRRDTVRALSTSAGGSNPGAVGHLFLFRFPLLALRQQFFKHAHIGRLHQVMIKLDTARVTTYFVLTVAGHRHQ